MITRGIVKYEEDTVVKRLDDVDDEDEEEEEEEDGDAATSLAVAAIRNWPTAKSIMFRRVSSKLSIIGHNRRTDNWRVDDIRATIHRPRPRALAVLQVLTPRCDRWESPRFA
ncbi:hypothetical protein Q1695_003490 [Nippostrongylus brasiliensis]|nr:hypothetical protein Q1695_003490 [Nippostrongylus brasiliensis]